jgi:hypothetical protein
MGGMMNEEARLYYSKLGVRYWILNGKNKISAVNFQRLRRRRIRLWRRMSNNE